MHKKQLLRLLSILRFAMTVRFITPSLSGLKSYSSPSTLLDVSTVRIGWLEMPNAKDFTRDSRERILLVGGPGTGKTALLRTLPGRVFVYMFDPSGMNTLAGADLEYEEFLPDRARTDPVPLAEKNRSKTIPRVSKPVAASDWDIHFNKSLDSGFFETKDWVCFDSLTMFGEAIMDQLLYMNNRFGQWPVESDYGPVIKAIGNTVRTLSNINCGVVFTAHEELIQDDLSKQILAVILTYGKLRYRMPAVFSEIYGCESLSTSREKKWGIRTVRDHRHQFIRSSLRGLEPVEDVTIHDWRNSNNGEQGLAHIFKKTQSN
jgi:hypothetical protein